ARTCVLLPMLLVDGLPGDPERVGDLLPGPPERASPLYLEHLEPVGQLAERPHGAQSDGGGLPRGRLDELSGPVVHRRCPIRRLAPLVDPALRGRGLVGVVGDALPQHTVKVSGQVARAEDRTAPPIRTSGTVGWSATRSRKGHVPNHHRPACWSGAARGL